MTLENSRAVFEAVMAGASAETVRSQIDDRPCEERELLFSALYGVRDDVEWTPLLRQPVSPRKSLKGENWKDEVSKEVHQGV